MSDFLQKITLSLGILLFPVLCSAQIEFSIKLNYDSTKWGVFAKPAEGIYPSQSTITGSGQVTIVAPTGFTMTGTKNFGGSWLVNSRSNAPIENPGYDYISFGLGSDMPKIIYQQGFETLLFSFDKTGDCPDSLYLISNNDVFSEPNSAGSNPGNDILVVDPVTGKNYKYSKNYDFCAWACKPCTEPLPETSDVTEAAKADFRVFPNPTSGIINIKSESFANEIHRVQVLDYSGKEVYEKRFKSGSINLSRLKPGNYHLNLFTKSGVMLTKKIQLIYYP